MSEFRQFCWARLKKYSSWFDALIQNKAYVDFATNAPGYCQLQSDTVLQQLQTKHTMARGGAKNRRKLVTQQETPMHQMKCRTTDAFCVSYNVNGYCDTF